MMKNSVIGKTGIAAGLLTLALFSMEVAAQSNIVLISGTINNIDPFANNKNTPYAGVSVTVDVADPRKRSVKTDNNGKYQFSLFCGADVNPGQQLQIVAYSPRNLAQSSYGVAECRSSQTVISRSFTFNERKQ